MSIIHAAYNERSWAIDLIGHLKHLSNLHNRSIKDAGGEQTVRVDGGNLFPDVLLFGDRATARILQGWELKMPDTPIDNLEFKRNAELKANALGLDSYVLWNVTTARLYVRQTNGRFILEREWNELNDLTTRAAVAGNRARWEALATAVFNYLNDLFDNNIINGRQFIDAYRSGGVTQLIMENSGQVADAIRAASVANAGFRAQMILWWDASKAEYGGTVMEDVLAQAVISNWIGKLLFAHILRETDNRAQEVANITDETTPAEALEIFRVLSEDCNFYTIFSDSIGLVYISDDAWDQLKQFNNLLNDLRLGSVDQAQLSNILESTVLVATRKLRGQYPTPIELARLLVYLTVGDISQDKIIDPCCGSGTIPRAAIEQKIAAGISGQQISRTVYASDQDPQAVQIATFALAKPSLMHQPIRLFKRDAFTLTPETQIDFRDPSNGVLFTEELGTFDTIVSNLPFVAQEGRAQYGNALHNIAAGFGEAGERFTGRADVAAYLPFSFLPLLNDGGKLGIIITNSWLGTDWGDDFLRLLSQSYHLESVVTSGAGRWFQNSKVVTNILILKKKVAADEATLPTKFVVLTRPLTELADAQSASLAAAQIEIGQTQNETMTIRAIPQEQLNLFRPLGLAGNAQFVNCDWILELPLIPMHELFQFKRGERRGDNDFFYPPADSGIEEEYLKTLAKSPMDFKRLSSPAIKLAFSCSRSIEELEALGHTGALNWIRHHESPARIAKLQTSRLRWYEMRADTLTDLVMFINYGQRLFIGRVNPPAFADQRLVRLVPINEIDVDLAHALLNSTISMFIIEGMGFGRGEGALDLSKDRVESYMHMLNPALLSQDQANAVKNAFTSLTQRDIQNNIADELEQDDRRAFDQVVIDSFGLNLDLDLLYESLLHLVEIRLTAIG